jgi:hypothetical protein
LSEILQQQKIFIMKKILATLSFVLIAVIAIAQVPEAINYQAVARNNSGQALANQSIKVRLSIQRGATTLYSETRTVTTNALGLFNVQIGSSGATTTIGSFTSIYWLNNTPANMLKVELDVNNSGVFTEMGTQTLATVPYAFAAKNAVDAVNLGGRYVDASITPNDGDVMRWSASDNAWKPATVSLPTVTNLHGLIGSIAPSAQWAFLTTNGNNNLTITITKPTTLVASGTTTLGHSTTGQVANDVSFMPAYQRMENGVPAGVITIFNPGNFPSGPITTSKTVVPTASSVTLTTPGTYRIGFAVRNNTTITLNNNDWLSGYVMVLQ